MTREGACALALILLFASNHLPSGCGLAPGRKGPAERAWCWVAVFVAALVVFRRAGLTSS